MAEGDELEVPEYAEGTAEFLDWGLGGNYDTPSPVYLFLDIIGYSEEHFGEPQFDLTKVSERFGYMEMGQLAKALDEYSDRPTDVMAFVEKRMGQDA